MASCLGTTSKLRSNSWSALVFALGCSNKLELLKVLILGFRVCSWPRPTGRQRWHKFPVHIPMTTLSAFAIRWTQPISFSAKLEERLTFLFLLQARMDFSAERATSLTHPEPLKKEVCVCETERVCGFDFITAYSAVHMMVSKLQPRRIQARLHDPRMALKMSQSDRQLSTKKSRRTRLYRTGAKPRFVSAS